MNDNFNKIKEVAEIATISFDNLSKALISISKTITEEYAKAVESFQLNLNSSEIYNMSTEDILKALERIDKPVLIDKNLCYNNYRKMHKKPMYRSRAYSVYLKRRKRK